MSELKRLRSPAVRKRERSNAIGKPREIWQGDRRAASGSASSGVLVGIGLMGRINDVIMVKKNALVAAILALAFAEPRIAAAAGLAPPLRGAFGEGRTLPLLDPPVPAPPEAS